MVIQRYFQDRPGKYQGYGSVVSKHKGYEAETTSNQPEQALAIKEEVLKIIRCWVPKAIQLS